MSSGNMVRQDNIHDYSVSKLHPLSKRADCRSKYSKWQITCTCMENTAESYCAETNLKVYFLKWFPVHFCRLRLQTMRKNENCARKAQVANTKFACQKSEMKNFAPHLRTCGFADYLSQTPSTGDGTLYLQIWYSTLAFCICDYITTGRSRVSKKFCIRSQSKTSWPPMN